MTRAGGSRTPDRPERARTKAYRWIRSPRRLPWQVAGVAIDRDDESESIAALRALEVLNAEPEAEFDALVRVASAVCGVPISLISLIDTDRQWFKANVGLPGVTETSRSAAFCAHAVFGDDLLEIPDALAEPRFADNPLVAGKPDIRFYAGAPLLVRDGQGVGTLCVIDRQPRTLDPMQRETLRQLSVAAARILEGRLATRQLQQASELAARAQLDCYILADPGRTLELQYELGEGSAFHLAHGTKLHVAAPESGCHR